MGPSPFTKSGFRANYERDHSLSTAHRRRNETYHFVFPDRNVVLPLRDPIPDDVPHQDARHGGGGVPLELGLETQRCLGSVCLEQHNAAQRRLKGEEHQSGRTHKGNHWETS